MTAGKVITGGCLLLAAISLYPQAGNYPLGARAMGTGHCSLVHRDLWGVFNNQATVVYSGGPAIGVFAENRFLLKEMNRIAVGGLLKAGKGKLLAGLDHFGGFAFSEMKAGIGYAMPFGKNFAAGLQIDYLRIAVGEGYPARHALTFEGGIYARITEKLELGMHIFNPLRVKWIATPEHLPLVFRGGMGFRPDASLSMFAEIHKASDHQAVFAAGCEYIYHEKFHVRAGITTGEARYTFGIGIRIKQMWLDLASSMHTYLGYSPQLSFTYRPAK